MTLPPDPAPSPVAPKDAGVLSAEEVETLSERNRREGLVRLTVIRVIDSHERLRALVLALQAEKEKAEHDLQGARYEAAGLELELRECREARDKAEAEVARLREKLDTLGGE